MKKIGIVIVMFISLLMVSCKPDYTTANELKGTWKLYKISDGSVSTTSLVGETYYAFSNISQNGGDYMEKYTFLGISVEKSGTFEVSEKGTRISVDLDGSISEYNLNLSSDEMSLSEDDATFFFQKL